MTWKPGSSLFEGKILIIDDEAAVRESIAAHLDDSGFEVIEAPDAEQGLVMFRAEHPDLVISDIKMPGMQGLELLSILCREAPDLPVIMISGVGVMDDVVGALRLGAWDYLIKPIPDLSVLEHAVCKCLERARLLEENKSYRAELEDKNAKLKESLTTLEEDQAAGHSVQMALLPKKEHRFHSYKISYRTKPSLYLSGDFVDYFEIDRNHIGFYIADVSGHGASSAFITVLLKSIFDHLVVQYQSRHVDIILQSDKVLEHISKAIYNAKLGKYLTMIYCVLDLEKNEITYSIGGHYPYPIVKTEDKYFCLEEKGFPVGIFDKAKYQKHLLALPDAFTLMMFSDGILEVIKEENLQNKEKKLMDLILSGESTVDGVFDKIGISQQDTVPDDITVLILHKDKYILDAKLSLGFADHLCVLQLQGELRFEIAKSFESAIEKVKTTVDLEKCVIDLSQATLVDSTIFGMIGSLVELRNHHHSLVLSIVAPEGFMRDSLLHLRFDHYFIIEDVAPACEKWITFEKQPEPRATLQGLIQQAHQKLLELGTDSPETHPFALDKGKQNDRVS